LQDNGGDASAHTEGWSKISVSRPCGETEREEKKHRKGRERLATPIEVRARKEGGVRGIFHGVKGKTTPILAVYREGLTWEPVSKKIRGGMKEKS